MNKQSGFGIASMVIGIISLFFLCFGVGLLGALGFIFAIVAFTQMDRAKGTAIAGGDYVCNCVFDSGCRGVVACG